MNIICPHCQLKGEIADAPAAFKTRVVCANCATVLIISVINDEALIMPARATEATPPADVEARSTEPQRPASLRERLALADAPLQASRASSLSAPDAVMQAAAAPAAVAAFTLPTEALPPPPPYPLLRAEAGTPFNAYGAGTRALRVSPLWLLAGGMAAVVFVVFCNWLFRSGTLPRHDAAVNLSQARTTMRDAASANDNDAHRVVQLSATPIAVTPDVAMPAGDSLAATSLTAQTIPSNEIQPAPASIDGAATAAFTVQLGAFNKPEQAQVVIDQLAAAGFSAQLDAHAPPRHKIWYRVQSGLFNTHDEAAAYGQQLLAQKAVATFIVAEVPAPR